MANITIAADIIKLGNTPRVAGWLYIFPMSDFWLNERTPIMKSSPNGGTPYLRVALVPTGENPTTFAFPSFSLPSTEDALINANGALWGAYIFDNADSPRLITHVAYLETFRMASTPSTQNIQDIAGYNTTSLPPVTNGDRIILGDLYAENVIASDTVTAAFFVGNGAGITGLTGATGGVANTGSTTINADSDANGTGIVSLQTRTIERVRIDNDGKLVALGAFDLTGLATLPAGAQFAASQANWNVLNIAGPSTSDQTAGTRIIFYPAAAGEHFAMGVESGALWHNAALAGAYRFYYGAVATERLQFNASGMQVDTANALYTLNFNSTFGGDSAVRIAADFAIQFAPNNGTLSWEMQEDVLRPATDDLYLFGSIDKRISEAFIKRVWLGDGTLEAGYRGIPQNSKSANYTAVLADAGKHIFHPSTDANARTFTIPANASVAYEIGTALSFINMTSQVVSIAITSDTMYLVGAGTTGTRSLAQYGAATAIKITSTTWLISGNGLT